MKRPGNGKANQFGAVVDPDKVKDERPAEGGWSDRGPVAALRDTVLLDPRTGMPRRIPAKRVIEVLRREHGGKSQEVGVVMTPLRKLYRNGSIDQDQYDVGYDFNCAFTHGGLHGIRAQDYAAVRGGGAQGGATAAVMDAREHVWRCFTVLGGSGRITSRALWYIAGEEWSARIMAGENGRNEHFWTASLVNALDMLVGRVAVYAGRDRA